MKNCILISLLLGALLLDSKACLFAQVSGKPVTSPVRELFTVINKDKKFVETLSKEDIRLMEDGVPQEVISLERQTEVPLALSFLIDVSISQERRIKSTRKVASSFIDAILRQGKDMAAIAAFSARVSVLQPLTSDLGDVQAAIQRVQFVPPSGYMGGGVVTSSKRSDPADITGSTAIWDSLWFMCEQFLPTRPNESRRVIILITDGEDTSSKKKRVEAIRRAVEDDVVIYTIGVGSEDYGIDEGTLRTVSERTGGRAFFPTSEKALQAAFSEIEQELRAQYVVTYSPTNAKRDGSYRKLRIELVNPEKRKDKLSLIYRPGYYL
jgi:Ca-activated chloride channel homolog